MEGGNYRGVYPSQQEVQMGAGISAEEAEFMLDGDDVHMTEVYVVGGTDVVVLDVAADLELDGIGILAGTAGLHRNNQRIKVLPPRGADTLDKV